MVLDPFGEVIAESNMLDDDVVIATLTPEKLQLASGRRYLKARRPELYGKLVEPQKSETLPGWRLERK
jgi:predicted amidohydrolase